MLTTDDGKQLSRLGGERGHLLERGSVSGGDHREAQEAGEATCVPSIAPATQTVPVYGRCVSLLRRVPAAR